MGESGPCNRSLSPYRVTELPAYRLGQCPRFHQNRMLARESGTDLPATGKGATLAILPPVRLGRYCLDQVFCSRNYLRNTALNRWSNLPLRHWRDGRLRMGWIYQSDRGADPAEEGAAGCSDSPHLRSIGG